MALGGRGRGAAAGAGDGRREGEQEEGGVAGCRADVGRGCR